MPGIKYPPGVIYDQIIRFDSDGESNDMESRWIKAESDSLSPPPSSSSEDVDSAVGQEPILPVVKAEPVSPKEVISDSIEEYTTELVDQASLDFPEEDEFIPAQHTSAQPTVKAEPLHLPDRLAQVQYSEREYAAAKQESDDESDEEPLNAEAEELFADHEDNTYYEDGAFKIKQVTAPYVVNRLVHELYNISRTKYLKLDPEYQRDVVWDDNRSSALVGSLLQGYFIPPLIFNVITKQEATTDGSIKTVHYRVCVDGKQRLTSVVKFFQGEIGVHDNNQPAKKWFYCQPIPNGSEQEQVYNILPESTKLFFRQRTFCCYEYKDLQDTIEENMFQLVQRGIPLTSAEKMRALSTSWATFGKEIEVRHPRVVNLSKQSRASGFRAVMTIFAQIIEVMHPTKRNFGSKPSLQSSPQVLTRLILGPQPLAPALKAKIKGVFDTYQELVDASSQRGPNGTYGMIKPNSAFDPAPRFLFENGLQHVKTFSPTELLATAILILVHKDTRSTTRLLGDIKELRHYLRECHQDLRMNSSCWQSTWEFIDKVLIKRRGGRAPGRRRKTLGRKLRSDEDTDTSEHEPGFDIENDIVGPTSERARRFAARRVRSLKPRGKSTLGKFAIPAPRNGGKYFASATPRGALANPNAPAFRAFENPNPLAVRRPTPPPTGFEATGLMEIDRLPASTGEKKRALSLSQLEASAGRSTKTARNE